MSARIALGNLIIDRQRYAATIAGKPVALTYTEFELLWALASQTERVVPRQELLRRVWGDGGEAVGKKLEVHLSRLRKKIVASWPYQITTVKKRGYALTEARWASEEQSFRQGSIQAVRR